MSDAPHTLQRPAAGWPDVLLFALILAAQLFGLGSYGLFEPHEGHFAGIGREMLLSGEWILPHLNGSHYVNKPPFLYWLSALSQSVFGTNEFGARLPLALFATGGCWVAWQWGRTVWGLAAGRIAAAVLATSTGWFLFSHQLMIDLPLSSLYLLGLYAYWHAHQRPESNGRWLAFYFVQAVQVFAKGPVGLLFNIVLILAHAVWIRDARLLLRVKPWLALPPLLVVLGPWLWLVERKLPGVIEYMIFNENVKRAVNKRWPPDYDVVVVSPGAFLVVALIWLAPWCLLLPQISAALRRGAGNAAEQSARFVLAAGALIPTLIFLPMPSRLIYYCLPTVGPFALLVALWWVNAHAPELRRGRTVFGALLLLIGLVIVSAAFWVQPLLKDIPDLAAAPATINNIDDMAILLGCALAAGAVALLLNRTHLAAGVLTAGIAVACLWNVKGFGDFDAIRSSKRTVLQLDPKLGPDALWIFEGSKEIGAAGGIAFYLQPKADRAPRFVLVMEDDPRRPPPGFPPPKAPYLIKTERLNELWSGPQPVVFITDLFHRDWERDGPRLPQNAGEPLVLSGTGHRRVYANAAARAKLNAAAANATPAGKPASTAAPGEDTQRP